MMATDAPEAAATGTTGKVKPMSRTNMSTLVRNAFQKGISPQLTKILSDNNGRGKRKRELDRPDDGSRIS